MTILGSHKKKYQDVDVANGEVEGNDRQTNVLICASPMQIIAAVQMRITDCIKGQADMILTDDVRQAGIIADNLRNTGLFRRVVRVNGKNFELKKMSEFSKFFFVFRFEFGKRISESYTNLLRDADSEIISQIGWNTIYFFNFTEFLYNLFDLCTDSGVNPTLIRFDEGILCYPMMPIEGKRVRLKEALRKINGKHSLIKYFRSYEVFYPELLKKYIMNDRKIVSIPLIRRDDESIKLFNGIFSYNPSEDNFKIPRYIYFPSPYQVDGINVDDMALLHEIADRVGYENLVIKPHPRDIEGRYETEGFQVMCQSYVPWEIMQMNDGFKDKILLSLTSTAIIGASAMMKDSIEAYYLYPCIKAEDSFYHSLCNKVNSIISDLYENGSSINVKIINSVEEIPVTRD